MRGQRRRRERGGGSYRDWGFRALAAINGRPAASAPWVRDLSDYEIGEVTYKSQWGQVYAGVDRTAGTTTVQGEVVDPVWLIDTPSSSPIASTTATDTVAGTGTGSAQTGPVYGRRPASQTLPSGNYQNTIIATVTF